MAAPQPSEKCARSDRDMNLQRIDRKLDAYVIVGHIHTLFHLHRKRKKSTENDSCRLQQVFS